MRILCLTIDLDTDANDPKVGWTSAVSLDRGSGDAPRFSSTGKGTALLAEMLDELGIKATFFAEARALHCSGVSGLLSGHEVALHGLEHEDFTGKRTGVYMDEGEMREIIERSVSLIRDCVGYQPKGFRAPYMDMDDTLLSFLPEYGIRYDSSYYAYAGDALTPYRLDNGIIEIPVSKGTDISGKSITSYLWPMHEGTRAADDFITMAEGMKEGAFVLATHSWHVVESRRDGILGEARSRKNVDDIRRILETLQDDGFRIVTMSEAASII